jgi:hypothetical protein
VRLLQTNGSLGPTMTGSSIAHMTRARSASDPFLAI